MTFPSRNRAAGIACACVVMLAGPAKAADWPDINFLRPGIAPGVWSGSYIGGHYGYTNLGANFNGATQQGVATILRQSQLEAEQHPSRWPVLGRTHVKDNSFGGFAGYNVDLGGSLVMGMDGAYVDTDLSTSTSGTLSRTETVGGTANAVTIAGSSSLRLHDYFTARFRAGYAFGQFLPYAAIGAAAGRFSWTTSTTVTVIIDPTGTPSTYGPFTETYSRDKQYVAGVSAALGMDVMITPNVFLRGEWEFVQFGKVGNIKPNINTARVGVAVKF